MPKIAFIGAGSWVFTKNLCSDILLVPALRESTIALMDIDAGRLERAGAMVEHIAAQRQAPARVEATLDRRAALRDADFVVTTFQQGGLDAYRLDIETPERFGVGQCVGDTLGPGGVFRGLRTIPVLLDICREMDELAAPDALLLNYVNPMAINCWAISRASGRPAVGLCHSVQGTSEMLARWLDVPYPEVDYVCAGINHQAFFLRFKRGGEDLYPALRDVARRPDLRAREPIRIELFQRFGYFVTESSGHASEYVPYFRKSSADIEQRLVPRFADPVNGWFGLGKTGGYLETCARRADDTERDAGHVAVERGHEYGSYIMEAIEDNRPVAINGNVPNAGLITNLPAGSCVEVPCLVGGAGIQPCVVGDLPLQLAALNRTNINVQSLAVEAALTGSVDALHQALLLDPMTAAAISPDRIDQMTDQMLEEQQQWLPQFRGRTSVAAG